MSNCRAIDPLVTPYVDGELPAADRAQVDDHLRRCPPCHARVAAETAVRDLLRGRRGGLSADPPSDDLRSRCAKLAGPRPALGAAGGRLSPARAFKALALAASLVLIVGGAFLYQGDRSGRVLAAELAADHIKCFTLDDAGLGEHEAAPAVESAMLSQFGWHFATAAPPRESRLDLVGARRCLYAHGVIAHLMYRLDGLPVSVFMLPGTRRPDEFVEALGHQAAIWSVDGRTFVLVARAPREEIEHLATLVRGSLR